MAKSNLSKNVAPKKSTVSSSSKVKSQGRKKPKKSPKKGAGKNKPFDKAQLEAALHKWVNSQIIIDEEAGLIFDSETELFAYFHPVISELESWYQKEKKESDFSEAEQVEMADHLDWTLNEPDEIFIDDRTFENLEIYYYLKKFSSPEKEYFYFAAAYLDSKEKQPNFVFIHYPTRFSETLDQFREFDLVYNERLERISQGMIDGDALGEGDELAIGLFEAMLKIRSSQDIALEHFSDLQEMREETIETADEIWRKTDSHGIPLVTFIKEYPDHSLGRVFYLALTVEDESAGIHSLLFSFPTTDESLVDRYRQGENLQSEDISQESSH